MAGIIKIVYMSELLKLLFIEDNEGDAELIKHHLQHGGYSLSTQRVENEAQLKAALGQDTWNLVISDYRLPALDAHKALETVLASDPDLPFIVISGVISEESAVALMRAGVRDYFKKDNLNRLIPVIERELLQTKKRQELTLSHRQQAEVEARYQSLFEDSPIALLDVDYSEVLQKVEKLRSEGVVDFKTYLLSRPDFVRECASSLRLLDVNQAAVRMYGGSQKKDLFDQLHLLLPPELVDNFNIEILMISEGRLTFEYETMHHTLDGEYIEINLDWGVVSGHEKTLDRVILSVQDVTRRNGTERRLRQTEFRMRNLLEHVPAVVYTEKADLPGQMLYISPQVEVLTGYAPDMFLSQFHFWKTVTHPEDREVVARENQHAISTGAPFRLEYRLLTRDQRVVWVRDEAVLIVDENNQALFWQGVVHDITDTRAAEAALLESQRRLAQLMSNLPGMAIRSRIGPDWGMEFASEGCLALTGLSSDQFISGNGGKYGNMIHPEDRPIVRQEITRCVELKIPFELTYRIILADGQEKWVWEKGQGVYDDRGNIEGLEAFVQDISERVKSEAENQRYLLEMDVVYQVSSAINRLMEPGQISTNVSLILEQKMGWHSVAIRLYDEITGKVTLLTVLDKGEILAKDNGKLSMINQIIPDSRKGLCGWVFQHNKPLLIPKVLEDSRNIQINSPVRSGMYAPLRIGERAIGSIAIESEKEDDFTEKDLLLLTTVANQAAISIENAQLFLLAQLELGARKQAETSLMEAQARLEQRVAERTAELKSANQSLEKAGKLKDEFLASMSHELRTPLTGILGLSEVLQLQTYGEMSQKQLTALKHIESSGRHLLELVNDMLDISRLEAQQMELTMGLCSLQQVCQNSYKEVEDLVLEKKQVYSIEVDPADLKVNADGRRLKQIITNLLSNASKFTPAGGRLGIQAGVNESEKKVTICVWDTGIGIREEDLPRLFQTFVQLDARLERQFNGTGLGLALVRRLTELHGGTISVESKIGEGSRFIVSLPLD